jgi:hypothetical protein
MSSKIALITIGTDGFVDYIQTPDGFKYNLGDVSVLKLITGLVPARTAKKAVRDFLENKNVMLSVDLDKMWSLLPFKRARYSSVNNSFMEGLDCNPQVFQTENSMIKSASYETFSSNIDLAEKALEKVAATSEIIDSLVADGKKFNSGKAKLDLYKIASKIAEIAQNVDLANTWVTADLSDLSKKANDIHNLFDPSETIESK